MSALQAMLLHAAQLPRPPPRAYSWAIQRSLGSEHETKRQEKTGIIKDEKSTGSTTNDWRRKAQDPIACAAGTAGVDHTDTSRRGLGSSATKLPQSLPCDLTLAVRRRVVVQAGRDSLAPPSHVMLEAPQHSESGGKGERAEDGGASSSHVGKGTADPRGGQRRVNAIDEQCAHAVLNASHDGAALAAEAEERRAGEALRLRTPKARAQRFGLRSAHAEAQDASACRRPQGVLVPRPRTSLAQEAPRRSGSALSHLTSAHANAWDQMSEADLVHTRRAQSSMGLHGHHAGSRAQANRSSLRSQNRPRSSWDDSSAGWRWWQASSCNTSDQAAPQQLEHADLLHKRLREPLRVDQRSLLDERLDTFCGVRSCPVSALPISVECTSPVHLCRLPSWTRRNWAR